MNWDGCKLYKNKLYVFQLFVISALPLYTSIIKHHIRNLLTRLIKPLQAKHWTILSSAISDSRYCKQSTIWCIPLVLGFLDFKLYSFTYNYRVLDSSNLSFGRGKHKVQHTIKPKLQNGRLPLQSSSDFQHV